VPANSRTATMNTARVSGCSSPVVPEPTAAEQAAGASLIQEPERLESRATDAPARPPSVQLLMDEHRASAEVIGVPHRGLALAVGGGAAAGPGIAVGGEASIGVVLDFTEPKISVFTSGAWGTAIAPGVSAGMSGQASVVADVRKFWGSGAQHGLNTPAGGASLNHTTPTPGGPRELNGVTASVGPSIGGDVHYFEGNTTERWSLSLNELKDAVRRFAELPGIRRFGL
jgi:hypothetical protein